MAELSPQRRLGTVLKGGIPDRVPCIPLVYYFAATYAGVPYKQFTTSMKAYRSAMDRCFDEVGPWDAMYPLPITMDAPDYDIVWGAGVGMKPATSDPGVEDTQMFQFTEASGGLMRETDYKKIIDYKSDALGTPYRAFFEMLVSRAAERKAGPQFWATYLLPHLARFGAKWMSEVIRWRLKKVPFFVGFSLEAPFDTFSMARGIEDFALDLRHRGDELEAAVMKLSRGFAYTASWICKLVRIPNYLLLVHRTSNDFISPKHYQRFVHPSIKLIAERLAQNGIVMGLHCDGNWDLNFEHMTDLPEGTYFQLDGFSDIVRAREILGNRFTIMGDVPPHLLAFGSPTEVEEYCAKVIKAVGKEGRFILSSGCEVPPNAKPENVRAMIRSAKVYGRYD